MASIGTFEAKTHFAALLERVARGETITITRHGSPVARLVPFQKSTRDTAKDAVRKLKAFRRHQTLGNVSVRQLIHEGRR